MADSRFFDRHGPFSLGDIAQQCGLHLQENVNTNLLIEDVAPLDRASAASVSFLDNTKYVSEMTNSQAGACFMRPEFADRAPSHMIVLATDEPYKAFARASALFYPNEKPSGNHHHTAVIDDTARIGAHCDIGAGVVIGPNVILADGVTVGPNTVIERGVEIGSGTWIASNVTISHALIGRNVVIHAGTRIGVPGFGFAPDPAGHVKIPQLGRVIIEDGCDIGGNTVIDRGAGPDTIIGAGTFIDNLCQIAHNVKIGRGVIMTGMNGISGSTELGDFVVIGGNAGIAGHLKIGTGAQIAAKSGVLKDIPAGEVWAGYPARPIRQWQKQNAAMRRLIKKDK